MKGAVSEVDVHRLKKFAPNRSNLLALHNAVGRYEGGAGVIALHEFGGFIKPAGDVVELLVVERGGVEQVGFLLSGLKGVADEGRVADNVVDAARHKSVPVERKRIAADDPRGVFKRKVGDALANANFGVEKHLVLGNPHGGLSNGAGKIVELNAVELIDGNFDVADGAQLHQFTEDIVLELAELDESFGEEIAGAAGGVEKSQRRNFILKFLERATTILLGLALGGVKLVVKFVEEKRLDELMNVVAGGVMHAARSTCVGIEVGLEKGAENGGIDGEPTESFIGLGRAGLERDAVRGDVIEGRQVERVAVEKPAVDVGKLLELRAERWSAAVGRGVEHGEQVDESAAVIGGIFDVIDELIVIENGGVLGVEAKNEADAKLVEDIFLVDREKFDGVDIVLEFAGREHLTSEGLTDAPHNLDGVLGELNLFDVFIVGVDEEAEASIGARQVSEHHGLRFEIAVDGGDAIHIVDAKLVEVADDDPTRVLRVGERIGITFSLLERREESAV